jgi:PKD repeat protein
MAANFTVNVSAGNVYSTNFRFSNTTPSRANYVFAWDFGDNSLLEYIANPTHTYQYSGRFNVTLSATNLLTNTTTTFSRFLSVDYAYRDYIKVIQIPDNYSLPGLITSKPFKIEVVTSQPNLPIIVDLFAVNSNSVPVDKVEKKWWFLNPTWRFFDRNRRYIQKLQIPGTRLFKDGVVVGLSGIGEFYFVDSLETENNSCPLLITATLETSGYYNYKDSNVNVYPSYANNETVKVGILWQVNKMYPTLFRVTNNLIEPVNKIQWSTVKIPLVITAHSDRRHIIPGSYGTLTGVLFDYPYTNQTGAASPVRLSLRV